MIKRTEDITYVDNSMSRYELNRWIKNHPELKNAKSTWTVIQIKHESDLSLLNGEWSLDRNKLRRVIEGEVIDDI